MRLKEEKYTILLGITMLLVGISSAFIQLSYDKINNYQQNLSTLENELLSTQNFHTDALLGATRLELVGLSGKIDLEELKKENQLYDPQFFLNKAKESEESYEYQKQEYFELKYKSPSCLFIDCKKTIPILYFVVFVSIGLSMIFYVVIYKSISERLIKKQKNINTSSSTKL